MLTHLFHLQHQHFFTLPVEILCLILNISLIKDVIKHLTLTLEFHWCGPHKNKAGFIKGVWHSRSTRCVWIDLLLPFLWLIAVIFFFSSRLLCSPVPHLVILVSQTVWPLNIYLHMIWRVCRYYICLFIAAKQMVRWQSKNENRECSRQQLAVVFMITKDVV